MDNEVRSIIRTLELQNEAKSQDLSIAYQRIVNLEQELTNIQAPDNAYVSSESQIDFIRKVADSRTKFAKEAQDIIDAIDNSPSEDANA